jgi:hypothetical protein
MKIEDGEMHHRPLVDAAPGTEGAEVLGDVTHKTADRTDLKMDISAPPGPPDDNARSREIIARALEFIKAHT